MSPWDVMLWALAAFVVLVLVCVSWIILHITIDQSKAESSKEEKGDDSGNAD